MPQIQVSVNQDQIAIDPHQIERAAWAILNALDCTDTELSIVVVDDAEMTRINKEYRQIDATTDVLSFAMAEGEYGDVWPQLLGDVVISAPTAELMSRQQHCPLPAVMELLLVHGILHLVGYDHEQDAAAAQLMQAKTLELLQMLGHTEESFDWYLQPAGNET